MSTARVADMATIDTLLEQASPQAEASDAPSLEQAPPTVDDLLKEEKLKQARLKTALDEQKLAPAQPEEEESSSAVGGQVDGTGLLGAAQDAAKKEWQWLGSLAGTAKGVLERARTPGTLFLPIALLVLFFFVLIPFNGYSRIAWLWLVITGNASLSGDAQAIATREQDMIALQEQDLSGLSVSAVNVAGAVSALSGNQTSSPTPVSKTPQNVQPSPNSPPPGGQFLGDGGYWHREEIPL